MLGQTVLPTVEDHLGEKPLYLDQKRGRGSLGLLALLRDGILLLDGRTLLLLFLAGLLGARSCFARDSVDEVEGGELVGRQSLLVGAEEGREEVGVRLRGRLREVCRGRWGREEGGRRTIRRRVRLG